MALQITVKDTNGSPIPGVEVKYSATLGLNEIETKTTNSSGIVTLTTFDTWLSGYVLDFKKNKYVSYRYSYSDHQRLPTGNLDITLFPYILYFKLYKYNEGTKAEELYKQTIKVEPYRYDNGTMTAQTAISSLYRDSDGYYYIDLRNYGTHVNVPIGYTNLFLFKITANDLTNYGSIFLLPNGFIKKRITDWDAIPYEIEITENTLPNQKMVFYPNTKRLTKEELKKCVVSNPHLMNDTKDDTYCPTNITYSTIYNMIKDSNNRDNNYISGVEDINFYQNKTLTINSNIPIKISIDAPGYAKPPKNNAVSPTSPFSTGIYYSADAKIKASVVDSDYELTNNERSISMSTDQTVTFEGKMKPYTFVITKIGLLTSVNCHTGVFDEMQGCSLEGHWKKGATPSSAITSDLWIAVSITDPINGGFVSFSNDVNGLIDGNFTEPLTDTKYEDFSHTISTGGSMNWLNKDDFIVACVFLSDPNIYLEFEANSYYINNAFHPAVTSDCPESGGGSGTTPGTSWAGGKYYVTITPNNNNVRVNAVDKNRNEQEFNIAATRTISADSMTIIGSGTWAYKSDKQQATDVDTLNIPYNNDTSSEISVKFS